LKYRTDCIIGEASSGARGEERLQNGRPPALILLDLKMPGLDGIDVLKFIRTREQTRYIPVVMLSSSNLEEDLKATYDAGANSFLYKAPDLSEFTEILTATLYYWIDLNLSPV
jgi:CheY-like chemotaxis protein